MRSSAALSILLCLALAFSGCGGSSIKGLASGTLQVSPGTVTFGSVTIGNAAQAKVSLVNLGSAPVQISSLNVEGKSFSLIGQIDLPITLAAAGGSFAVSLQFNPAVSGAATGQLTISSNASTASASVIDLNGTGVAQSLNPALSALKCSASIVGTGTDSCSVTLTAAAESGGMVVNLASNNAAVTVPASVTVPEGATSASFSASIGATATSQAVILTATAGGVSENLDLEVGVATPTMSVSVASVAFGNVAVNAPVTQSVTLTSTGAAALTISSATMAGTGFTVSGATFPVTLSPGQATTLTVQFDPSLAGAVTGQLTLASNSSTGNTATVALSGAGVPTLTAFSCANSSMTGSGTDTCSVTLNAPAASGGYAVGLASNNSAVTVPASVTVAAGAASANFPAAVSSVTTAQTATLSASVGGTPLTFGLQLNAAFPDFTVGSTSLNFGNVAVNSATTQSVTVTSTGTAAVTISSATVSGLGFSISGATFPLTLGSNQTATLTVQFDPSVAGQATGQLILVSNASSGNTTTVALSGTGMPVLSALSCTNSSMAGSGTDTCTVSLNAAAASSGFTVGLASNNSAVTVPASVTVAAGSTTASFSAAVASVSTTQNVTLSATAGTVSENFAMVLNVAAATLSVNATSITFGEVTLNIPATQTVTLTSTGSLPVTVNSATVTGTGFSISGTTFPVTLNPNQTATVNVIFDPLTAGDGTGQLTITSNSSTNGTAVISLSGTGQATYQVDLTWNAPTSSPDPVAAYNIYRAPNGSTNYQLMGSVGSSALSYTDSNNIVDGQIYDYIVESVDASGNVSAPSNTAPVTVP